MRAMAIRILFRRKMTVRRIMASATDMIITVAGKHTHRDYLLHTPITVNNM